MDIHQWTKTLYTEFDTICYIYGIALPRPAIVIKPLERTLGYFDPATRAITISSELIVKHPWRVVVEVLKHEMAHYLVYEECGERQVAPHGSEFQHACHRMAVAKWARRALCELSAADTLESESSADHPAAARIRKLLALSRSDNENEALLAMAKAKELSERHSLEMAAFAGSEPSFDMGMKEICHNKKVTHRYEVAITSLLTAFFHVDVVFGTTFCAKTSATYKTAVLYGSKSNLEIAEYVYFYIYNALPRLFKAYREKTSRLIKVKKMSYYLGFLDAVRQNLAQNSPRPTTSGPNPEAGAIEKNTSAEQGLMLYNQHLADFVNHHNPKLRTVTSGSYSLDRHSYEGGVSDGKNFEIHRGISNAPAGRRYLNSGDAP